MNNSLKKEIEEVKNIRNSVSHIMQLQDKMEKSQDTLSIIVKNYTDKIEVLENQIKTLEIENEEYKRRFEAHKEIVDELLEKHKIKTLSKLDKYLDKINNFRKLFIYIDNDGKERPATINELMEELAEYRNNEAKLRDEYGFEDTISLVEFVEKYKDHKCNDSKDNNERLLSFDEVKEAEKKEEIQKMINDYVKNNILNVYKVNNLNELDSLINKKPEIKDIKIEESQAYLKLKENHDKLKSKLEDKQVNIEEIKETERKQLAKEYSDEIEEYNLKIKKLEKEKQELANNNELLELKKKK